MAENETPPEGEDADKPKGLMSKLMVPLLVLISASAGFAVPMMMGGGEPEEKPDPNAIEIPDPSGKPAFLEFGEVVANLNDGRMTRYLRLSISMQVDDAQLLKITDIHKEQEAVLRNWLISHISDKTMDDIRGKAGQDRLRQEILGQFNMVMFPDGIDRVSDILFQEFNVQ